MPHTVEKHSTTGMLKLVAKSGWFAAKASHSGNICKIYPHSFESESHLRASGAGA